MSCLGLLHLLLLLLLLLVLVAAVLTLGVEFRLLALASAGGGAAVVAGGVALGPEWWESGSDTALAGGGSLTPPPHWPWPGFRSLRAPDLLGGWGGGVSLVIFPGVSCNLVQPLTRLRGLTLGAATLAGSAQLSPLMRLEVACPTSCSVNMDTAAASASVPVDSATRLALIHLPLSVTLRLSRNPTTLLWCMDE